MIETAAVTQYSQFEDMELFLLHLRYKEGRLIKIEGNRPQLLDDEDHVWVVYSGAVDLFAVPLENGNIIGARRHLFHTEPGQVLFGITAEDDGFGLLANGATGTQLLKIPRQRYWALARELEYASMIEAMVDNWVILMTRSLARRIPPKSDLMLGSVKPRIIDAGEIVSTNEDVLWTKIAFGEATYLCQSELAFDHTAENLPMTRFTWLASRLRTQLDTTNTAALLDSDEIEKALNFFHSRAKLIIGNNWQHDTEVELDRLIAKAETEKKIMQQALSRLRQPLHQETQQAPVDSNTKDLLLTALKPIGKVLNVAIKPPVVIEHEEMAPFELLDNIARRSDLRTREVALRGQWWRQDGGPLLAFIGELNRPVSLLFRGRRYMMFDPTTQTETAVNHQMAATLDPLAYSFYRPFPNKKLGVWDVVKFGLEGNRDSFVLIMIAAALMALIGLLPPIASGIIFDQLIPGAQVNLLLQVGIGLLAAAMSIAIFRTVRGITLIRLLTRVNTTLQAAIWDRLLKLPLTFFTEYSAGNLGSRAMGFSTISRYISGYVLTTILTGFFSIFNLALLFYYSSTLALVAVALVLVAIAVMVLASYYFVRYQRELSDIQGDVSGLVLQLLTGIAKFRVAGAEHHAFALWSEGFAEQKEVYTRSRGITNKLTTFNIAFFLLSAITLFAVLSFSTSIELSTGDFVAFNLAFAQFTGAWILLGSTLISVLTVIPIYERLQPILHTLPEVDESKLHPGELKGNIEVNHLSFSYGEDGPTVLHDVSMKAEQGEFIALVGPSGSGKSTMMRLLLGFEQPDSGGVYYDDQDIVDLDLRELRQQLGVVLQNATLMNGDIFENIVGASSSLTVDDAWEAARKVGVDKDIENMPMGMHTIISERGSNLSGGQRQRILIAASIVNRPRVIFFDEATSALDNKTQEIVSRSLEHLQATRIVIAHRLSTIINADRIYVFDKGHIVQSGNYQTLINEPGPFAEMARRQMA